MLLVFFGPSCSGKSSVASVLARRTGATVWTGRDYLRLARDEANAWQHFVGLLQQAADLPALDSASIIYVASDLPHGDRAIPEGEGVRVVRFTADLDVLTDRFAKRIGGPLSPAVAGIIERSRHVAAEFPADLELDSTRRTSESIAQELLALWRVVD